MRGKIGGTESAYEIPRNVVTLVKTLRYSLGYVMR